MIELDSKEDEALATTGVRMLPRATGIIFLIILSSISYPLHAAESPAQNAQQVTIGEGSNTAVLDTSTVGACQPTFTEHYTRYTLHHTGRTIPDKQYALITQKFDVGTGCFEGFHPANISLTATPIDIDVGKLAPAPIWSVNIDGAAFGEVDRDFDGELYRAEIPGCCGSEATFKYYNLNTGALVGSSTKSLIWILSKKSKGPRYYTIQGGLASSPEKSVPSMATIFYADPSGMKVAISINADKPSNNGDWGVMIFSLSRDGKDLSFSQIDDAVYPRTKLHINMVCQCDLPPLDITIPIADGDLDTAHAVISGASGVTLTKTSMN